jgi:hypothetical protein
VKKKLLTVFYLIIIIVSTFAINVRGEVNSILSVNTDTLKTEFKIFDLTGINIQQNPFIEGMELTISIPEDLNKYRDSFMLNIYYKLDSDPNTALKAYQGSLLVSSVVPVSKKMFISIPFTHISNDNSLPGSIISKIINKSDLPLLLTITPVMKGIPSTVLTSIFQLEIIPIKSNKGILELNISGHDSGDLYTIILDGSQILPKSEYILDEGIHQLIIKSDNYKEISRSFVIDNGKKAELDITLEQLLSTVSFETPEGAKVILDGVKIEPKDGKNITIDPGEHVVRMELGDYFLSKKFTIINEKNYKISLFLDILVQEN